MKKITLAIIFGGKSAEHEVSLQSARNVYDALDKERYDPVLIGIDKTGKWILNDSSKFLLNEDNPRLISLNKHGRQVSFVPESKGQLSTLGESAEAKSIDVAFPILHGPMGEDGTVQGLLKLADIPFVGADVLGSAVGMDKDVMKRLLRDAGIPIADFIVLHDDEDPVPYQDAVQKLGSPLFIKPANMGSSVGINRVTNKEDYHEALKTAFCFDTKVLIEQAIQGRELECAVLGNRNPAASIVGEVVPAHDFYSYEDKYIDENGAVLEIPAKISAETMRRVQETAVQTFKVLSCEGLGRVDMFLTKNQEIIVNEINTIPGFTRISMYPKLWEHSGIPYAELINKLVELAIERHKMQENLKTSY